MIVLFWQYFTDDHIRVSVHYGRTPRLKKTQIQVDRGNDFGEICLVQLEQSEQTDSIDGQIYFTIP